MTATLLSIIVSLIILLQTTLLPPVSSRVNPPNNSMTTDITINLTIPMTDDPLERYLLEGLLAGQTSFNIESLKRDLVLPDLSVVDLVGVASHINLQYPQLGSIFDAFVAPEKITLDFTENVTVGDAATRRAALEDVIRELLSGYDWSSMSDYEKSLRIHDIILDCVDYDYEAAAYIEGRRELGDLDPADVNEAGTAHGALVKQRGVCTGYAQAYQLLAQVIGLESYYLEGDILNAGYPLQHAWNTVKMDDDWVIVDTTWDDTGKRSYAWLHLPASYVDMNRVTNDFFYENIHENLKSTTTDYTWFAKNDRVVTAKDAIDVIEEWAKTGEKETAFLIGPLTREQREQIDQDFYARFAPGTLSLYGMEFVLEVSHVE